MRQNYLRVAQRRSNLPASFLLQCFQQARRLRPPIGTVDASAGTPRRRLLHQQLAAEWNIGKTRSGTLFFCFFFRPPSTAHRFSSPLLSSARRVLLEVKPMFPDSPLLPAGGGDVARVQSHCGLHRGFLCAGARLG